MAKKRSKSNRKPAIQVPLRSTKHKQPDVKFEASAAAPESSRHRAYITRFEAARAAEHDACLALRRKQHQLITIHNNDFPAGSAEEAEFGKLSTLIRSKQRQVWTEHGFNWPPKTSTAKPVDANDLFDRSGEIVSAVWVGESEVRTEIATHCFNSLYAELPKNQAEHQVAIRTLAGANQITWEIRQRSGWWKPVWKAMPMEWRIASYFYHDPTESPLLHGTEMSLIAACHWTYLCRMSEWLDTSRREAIVKAIRVENHLRRISKEAEEVLGQFVREDPLASVASAMNSQSDDGVADTSRALSERAAETIYSHLCGSDKKLSTATHPVMQLKAALTRMVGACGATSHAIEHLKSRYSKYATVGIHVRDASGWLCAATELQCLSRRGDECATLARKVRSAAAAEFGLDAAFLRAVDICALQMAQHIQTQFTRRIGVDQFIWGEPLLRAAPDMSEFNRLSKTLNEQLNDVTAATRRPVVIGGTTADVPMPASWFVEVTGIPNAATILRRKRAKHEKSGEGRSTRNLYSPLAVANRNVLGSRATAKIRDELERRRASGDTSR